MKKTINMLWIAALLIGLSSSVHAGSNEGVGTLVGGIAGGLLGNKITHGSSKTAATIGGAVLGSLVGNHVGHAQDQDRDESYSPPQHRCADWETYPHAGNFSHWPRHAFIGSNGHLCRYSPFVNDLGDRINAVYCCYRMSAEGCCLRWVRMH